MTLAARELLARPGALAALVIYPGRWAWFGPEPVRPGTAQVLREIADRLEAGCPPTARVEGGARWDSPAGGGS